MNAPARRFFALSACVFALACSEGARAPIPTPAEPTPSERATVAVKAYVDEQLAELVAAAHAIHDAAPEPDADGWSYADDREAVDAMREGWRRARAAYERVEGAISILFPAIDRAIDSRYEHTAELGVDDRPFDANGFIGVHAIERILWADAFTPEVATFERALAGFVRARTPTTEDEARAFRDELCRRLVDDTERMQSQFEPLALDPQTAWRGITGSIEEQVEKIGFAATGQNESRYARTTLRDMRSNLAGGRAVFEAYAPLIEAHPEASALQDAMRAQLAGLEEAYGIEGDALPEVPEGFDPDAPTEADLATPYGRMFAPLSTASDPNEDGSFLANVRLAGEAMGISPLSR